jgi:hypothetical protein
MGNPDLVNSELKGFFVRERFLMLRMSKRLFLFGLAGLIIESVFTAPLTARPSETNGVSGLRIARLGDTGTHE